MSQSTKSHSFVVIKHIKKTETNKELACKVILKTSPTDPFQAKLEISDTTENIFARFPLNETVEVSLRNPQSRLD